MLKTILICMKCSCGLPEGVSEEDCPTCKVRNQFTRRPLLADFEKEIHYLMCDAYEAGVIASVGSNKNLEDEETDAAVAKIYKNHQENFKGK